MSDRFIDPEKKSTGEVVKMLATNFCIIFTIFMLFSMVFGMIYADEEAKQGIIYCWSIAGAVLLAAILQIVFFTPAIIKRLGYSNRVILFGACFYVVLTILAVVFQWFPADLPSAWFTWTVIYIAILIFMSVIFTLTYRRKIKVLNENLARYKSQQK